MRQAIVNYKGKAAGTLTQQDDGRFAFRYADAWFASSDQPAISLTLPKTRQEHQSEYLFACFYNMLPEGTNKDVVCFEMRIDPSDHFSLLMHTAQHDSIGAITIHKLEANVPA